jgi:hypothetical protein
MIPQDRQRKYPGGIAFTDGVHSALSIAPWQVQFRAENLYYCSLYLVQFNIYSAYESKIVSLVQPIE